MFDYLTGLSSNNFARGLTQRGGLNSFHAGNLFTSPLGSTDNLLQWNPRGFFTHTPSFSPNVLPGFSSSLLGINVPPLDLGMLGAGNFLGTGNFAANQAIGEINGYFRSGGNSSLGALSNRSTVLTGGLQALPQPVNGVANFF